MVVDRLRSLAAQASILPLIHVLILDNASGDRSADLIASAILQEGWSDWATVRPLDKNGGFAYGNNCGIKEAMALASPPDYIMLLNPDTIVRERGIEALVEFMDANVQVGIAGSRLYNADGVAECSAHNSPSPLGELDAAACLGPLSRALGRFSVTTPMRDTDHECDWACGASLLIRRAVIEQVGLMDEGFFLYFEEVDYCLRVRQAGWKIWYVPESEIIHLEGSLTGIQDVARRRPPYWYNSRRRYFVKHFGRSGLMLADALWAIGRASLGLRRCLGLGSGGGKRDPKFLARDLLLGDLQWLVNPKNWRAL